MVSIGKVSLSLPLLCELELVEFKRKGYYLRLLPAQCTLWDNVLIGRDPPTAEVMLSLLRKAEGGLEVGGWLRPSRFKKEEKKIKFLLHLFEPTFAENYRINNNKKGCSCCHNYSYNHIRNARKRHHFIRSHW